jgi:hypothetical protein
MIWSDWLMLSLPAVSLLAGIKKQQFDETETFWFGFFCASLVALAIYAQGSDTGLTWLKAGG